MLEDQDVIDLIERIVGDRFCEDLACIAVFQPTELTERERLMQERISQIYQAAHSHLKSCSCYHAHEIWRKQSVEKLKLFRSERETG